MKKIVYLAPLALLGVGAKASANQVSIHISNALQVYEQESGQNQLVGQNENERSSQQAKTAFPNGQNQPVGQVKEATHISRLDSGLIDKDSSVENRQDSQVIKISRSAIPTNQELNESKESVAGQYVQVQQNRVAQFNKGSKIYGLNNSNQLGKSNGDGYVITNAGMYNGRAVDIGVTINNVQNNQGSYTTKWSNGDKATQTGKVDNNFSYQNGVIVNSNAVNPVINSGQIQIRNRIENQNKTYQLGKVYVGIEVNDGRPGYYGYKDMYVLDPVDLAKELAKRKISPDDNTSVMKVAGEMLQPSGGKDTGFYDAAINNGKYVVHTDYNDYNSGGGVSTYDDTYTLQGIPLSEFKAWFDKNKKDFVTHWSEGTGNDPGVADMGESDALYIYNHMHDITGTKDVYDKFTVQPIYASDGTKLPVWKPYYKDTGVYNEETANYYSSDGDLVQDGDVLTPNKQNADLSIFGNDFVQNANYNFASPVEVVDHLQIDQVKNGSLNYDYTIRLYDAQTGDLITSLKPEYKNGVKVGKTATNQDTVMNNAIKAKIQAINANNANAAYTGTAANDDIVFNRNTVHVNYVDEQGQPINVPGYDIDVDNLTSGNYQVPQNYVLANANGFKVTKNTHEVNGITVTDSYNFIDQGNNKVTDNGRTLNVVLEHGTKDVDLDHSHLSNDATNNVFVINNGAKRQINSQSRHFGATSVLDLVTNKIIRQGDWQLSGKSNFDQTNINNDLVGYGNAIHSNLTFLAL